MLSFNFLSQMKHSLPCSPQPDPCLTRSDICRFVGVNNYQNVCGFTNRALSEMKKDGRASAGGNKPTSAVGLFQHVFLSACWNSSSQTEQNMMKELLRNSGNEESDVLWRTSANQLARTSFPLVTTDTLQPDCFFIWLECLRGASWGDAALLHQTAVICQVLLLFFTRRMQVKQHCICSSVTAVKISLVIFLKLSRSFCSIVFVCRHCDPQDRSEKTSQLQQKDGSCFVLVSVLLERHADWVSRLCNTWRVCRCGLSGS